MKLNSFYVLIVALFMGLGFAHAQVSTNTNELAERMLVYQLRNGGWSKQMSDGSKVNYQLPIDDTLLEKIKEIDELHATIDNEATSREIKALVAAYKQTPNDKYLKAAERGISYLLKAQYKNGGWPQYFPDRSSYRAEITYNDDAMINVLNIMLSIATQANNFEVVNPEFIPKAADAVKRGLDCILKTQIRQNGTRSIWAAQYDQFTLEPAKARSFEPASLSTKESVEIVRFLMRIKNPTPEIQDAINQAVKWFEAAKIQGFVYATINEKEGRGLIPDSNSVIWARFYDIKANQPIFGDRDNSVKTDIRQVSLERRNGYAWYGSWALSLLNKDYPKWLKTLAQ